MLVTAMAKQGKGARRLDRHPAPQGDPGHPERAPGSARVHRQPDLHQHQGTRGRADPGDGVRQPEPAVGRPAARRDRAEGPHPRGAGPADHDRDHHGADGFLLRAVHRGPVRDLPVTGARHRQAHRHVPVP